MSFGGGSILNLAQPGIYVLLTPNGEVFALRMAIAEHLYDWDECAELAANYRRIAVTEYALEIQARRYVELYESVLGQREANHGVPNGYP